MRPLVKDLFGLSSPMSTDFSDFIDFIDLRDFIDFVFFIVLTGDTGVVVFD